MLYYKRLEQGTFELPQQSTSGEIELSWETLVLMIAGIKLKGIIRKNRYQKVG